jgi:hypothetical protein
MAVRKWQAQHSALTADCVVWPGNGTRSELAVAGASVAGRVSSSY